MKEAYPISGYAMGPAGGRRLFSFTGVKIITNPWFIKSVTESAIFRYASGKVFQPVQIVFGS